MSTYYKHTKRMSVDIPYSFRCEQCMQETGTLTATIQAQAELNTNFKNLNEKKQQKLDEMAQANLVREVKRVHQNAVEKQIYDAAFKDKCPSCQKPQSWAVSGVKNGMFGTPIVCVILGIILGAGCYFFSGVENNMMIAIVVAGACFVGALVSLIWNIAKLGNKKRQTSSVIQQNAPVIQWAAVQELLSADQK